MREEWTGQIVGQMHVAEVTLEELGEAAGIGKAYVSMILNGQRRPAGARERLEGALRHILAEREKANKE